MTISSNNKVDMLEYAKGYPFPEREIRQQESEEFIYEQVDISDSPHHRDAHAIIEVKETVPSCPSNPPQHQPQQLLQQQQLQEQQQQQEQPIHSEAEANITTISKKRKQMHPIKKGNAPQYIDLDTRIKFKQTTGIPSSSNGAPEQQLQTEPQSQPQPNHSETKIPVLVKRRRPMRLIKKNTHTVDSNDAPKVTPPPVLHKDLENVEVPRDLATHCLPITRDEQKSCQDGDPQPCNLITDNHVKGPWTEQETQTLVDVADKLNISNYADVTNWNVFTDLIPTRSLRQIRSKLKDYVKRRSKETATSDQILSQPASQNIAKLQADSGMTDCITDPVDTYENEKPKRTKRKQPVRTYSENNDSDCSPAPVQTVKKSKRTKPKKPARTCSENNGNSDETTAPVQTSEKPKRTKRKQLPVVPPFTYSENSVSDSPTAPVETDKKTEPRKQKQPARTCSENNGNSDSTIAPVEPSEKSQRAKRKKPAAINSECNGNSDLTTALVEKSTRTKRTKPKQPAPICSDKNDSDSHPMETTSFETQPAKTVTTTNTSQAEENSPSNASAGQETEEEQSPSPTPFIVKLDPNEFYVEEEAHLYHNPPLPSLKTAGVLPKDLQPIPPPPPPPSPPNTGMCKWSFDPINRTYFADFSPQQHISIDTEDEKFMLQVMERDDLTLISQGLLDRKSLDPSLWTIDNIAASLDQDFFHRLRRFDTVLLENGTERIFEVDGPYSMRIVDFCRYLHQRAKYFNQNEEIQPSEKKFTFTNHMGKEIQINISVSALYLIDLDIKKLLPEMHEDFRSAFRLPAVLPGGRYCMMNKVTADARPFMGPNLYVTPPASFTHFHQDGHGTVDSGHLVISGYNEVVLLRRLTERHKRHALWLLTGSKEQAGCATQKFLDGLYSEPHSDGLGEKPHWPTNDRIQECKKMGYCPSIIMLKPGQLIHIGKGRLHAFRKMSNKPLPENDCHCTLRQQIINNETSGKEELCVSIAWDWMFRGSTARGIYREVVATLEAAILTRKRGRLSLAIPELALLRMAQTNAKPSTSFKSMKGLLGSDIVVEVPHQVETERMNTCKGILAGLQYVVNEHLSAIDGALRDVKKCSDSHGRVSLAHRPNSHENPELSTVDPHGNSDFSCKLCRKELSNVYYHCDGCEKLLHKDFNLCVSCHTSKYYARLVLVHPHNKKRHATINHTGDMKYNRASRCPCKNGPACKECGYCLGCSCRCHTQFTLNFRLFDKNVEQGILERVKAVALKGKEGCENDEARYLYDEEFTARRLDDAKVSWGHHDEFIL